MSFLQEFADLEIGVHRHDNQFYRLEPRLLLPGDEGDRRSPGSAPLLTSFDLPALDALFEQGDLVAYGKQLGQALFLPGVQTLLTQGRAGLANNPPVPLRLRINIGPSVPDLHRLRWETVRDPLDPDRWLALDVLEPFSRYLSSYDWRPVHLRPRGNLSALVVVANPAPRAGDGLAPVDVPGELARARKALQNVNIKVLCSDAIPDPDRTGPPTLSELIAALDKDFDILYLVCHGKLINGVAKVWLEDENGQVDVVSAEEDLLANGQTRPGLVTQLTGLSSLPRLVVLASCESAGTGFTADKGVLSAMGPRLVEAGIPAVLAMQGSISMASVERFMPGFFEGVCGDGLVDLAVSNARRELVNQGRPDWWMPVLFMRLRSGRIWYDPGFAGANPDFETWPDLTLAIKNQQCTPIIGPGLLEFLIGSTADLAEKWADTLHFPMAPYSVTDLPRVARYLATIQSPAFPTGKFSEYLIAEVKRRHAEKLKGLEADCPLPQLIHQVGVCARELDEGDPFRVLAAMPVKIYLTTTPDDLLFDALKEAKKDPQVALCPWNRSIEQPDSAFEADDAYKPTVAKPLIYHLFGRLDQPDSLVISEDDYFNYLIWSIADQNREKPLTPPIISRALASNALLFLGFQIDDWDFRVLFHSITNPEAGQSSRRPTSVAVQIGPDESRFLQPRQARKYLEKYYSGFRVKTNVFWGTGPDFVRQVWDRRAQWQ